MAAIPRTSLRFAVLLLAVLGLLVTQVWSAAPARAAIVPVYDGVPATHAPNYPSLGYAATSTAEFGDLVELGGTAATSRPSPSACRAGRARRVAGTRPARRRLLRPLPIPSP